MRTPPSPPRKTHTEPCTRASFSHARALQPAVEGEELHLRLGGSWRTGRRRWWRRPGHHVMLPPFAPCCPTPSCPTSVTMLATVVLPVRPHRVCPCVVWRGACVDGVRCIQRLSHSPRAHTPQLACCAGAHVHACVCVRMCACVCVRERPRAPTQTSAIINAAGAHPGLQNRVLQIEGGGTTSTRCRAAPRTCARGACRRHAHFLHVAARSSSGAVHGIC